MSKEVFETFSGNPVQAAREAAEHREQKRQNLRKAVELGVVRRRSALYDLHLHAGWL
ncbi:MAG TPA: hypothetical protein VIH75_08825 [Candidatus Sulfotelmatobacter sp.]